MVRKRITIIEELHEEEQTLVCEGEDFQTCLDFKGHDNEKPCLSYKALVFHR